MKKKMTSSFFVKFRLYINMYNIYINIYVPIRVSYYYDDVEKDTYDSLYSYYICKKKKNNK